MYGSQQWVDVSPHSWPPPPKILNTSSKGAGLHGSSLHGQFARSCRDRPIGAREPLNPLPKAPIHTLLIILRFYIKNSSFPTCVCVGGEILELPQCSNWLKPCFPVCHSPHQVYYLPDLPWTHTPPLQRLLTWARRGCLN